MTATKLVEQAAEHQMIIAEERRAVAELQRALDERSAEVEPLKKKANRELAVNGGLQEPQRHSNPPTPLKELSAAREEIKGLK